MELAAIARDVSRIGALAEETAEALASGHRVDLKPAIRLMDRGMRSCFALLNGFAAKERAMLVATVKGSRRGLKRTDRKGRPWRITPAVHPDHSVTADGEHLICLEDGQQFRMLKRHLKTEYGLTPDQYRARWGLPADYPMAAPAFHASKSEFAKAHGLGKREHEQGEVEAGPKRRVHEHA